MRNFRFIIIIFFATIIFSSCENDMKTVDILTAQKEANIETGIEIEILYSDLGIVKAKLEAPVVKHYKSVREPYTEMPNGIKLFFYDDSLHVESQLTAGYGMIKEKTNVMMARDHVEVIGTNGDKLNTEELYWNDKTKKISSDKYVTIKTKDEILYGDGFTSDQDLKNYKILHPIGSFKLKGNEIPN